MALEKTNYFRRVVDDQLDPAVPNLYSRPPRYGLNDSDSFLAQNGDWRVWWSKAGPHPSPYHVLVNGQHTVNVAAQRVERVDYWGLLNPPEIRGRIKEILSEQIPELTVNDTIDDHAAQAAVEQLKARESVALSELAVTADGDLESFNTDLSSYQIHEPEYAANLVSQETANLARHHQITDAGATGIYTPEEESEISQRIAHNAEVSRADSSVSGILAPTVGAQRGDVALDGEMLAKAIFFEDSVEYAGQPYYLPRVMIDRAPEGIVVAQLFAMIYNKDNVYLTWMPFEEQPDGSWLTPVRRPDGVPWIPPGRIVDEPWRVAVSYMGTSAAHEITRRVHLIPPGVTRSIVRWGGRTS